MRGGVGAISSGRSRSGGRGRRSRMRGMRLRWDFEEEPDFGRRWLRLKDKSVCTR
jgi:hypothetical protein